MFKTFFNRARFRLLLAATVALMVTMMWHRADHFAVFCCALLLTLAGINALPSHKPMYKVVIALGVINTLMMTLVQFDLIRLQVSNLSMAALYIVLFSSLIHRLTRERPVTGELLYGLVAIYLQIALLFAIFYQAIETLYPNAFAATAGVLPLEHDDFTYFSMITLTTVGYGDIYPMHPLARMLVSFEAVTGVLFIGLSMARSLMLINDDPQKGLE
ncbi:Ion channel [Pseudomonas pohangensis]|uniref:Ion channel n=1 Tax=Pseudomonas pohangensis TaxID=364197 RepID=A0A1H2ENN0_9PSED|nr:potassium channel family protein [Pseudomonas pohangensis]SDT96720.1 Ion channel [Pseudomonas pohangensis]